MATTTTKETKGRTAVRPQAVDLEVHHVKNSPECGDKRAAFEKLDETMKELQEHVEALGKLFSPTSAHS
jgi:hypothetical protein